jgi:hypothetical protein
MANPTRDPAKRGSQKWIQTLVNEKPHLLNSILARELGLSADDRIAWLSPLCSDGYAEYSDHASLDRLGVTLHTKPLPSFWPRSGPHWDALGKTSVSQKLLLVEAKSHITELISTARASPASLRKIRASLDETKRFLGSTSPADWTVGFYQYANRLAHLCLFRQNDLPAYLICVYFLNDAEMAGPSTVEEWQVAIQLLHAYLGLGKHKLQEYVADVFIDVAQIQSGRS